MHFILPCQPDLPIELDSHPQRVLCFNYIFCQIKQDLTEMTFLDKFKGKTNLLTKEDVGGILGRATSQPNTPLKKNINASFTVDLPNNDPKHKKLKKIGSHNVDKQAPEQSRIQKINPFSVSNPFYLDEAEREQDERLKKERQIKQRLERERRKRHEIEQRMAKFQKINRQKYNNKQWIKLGGLGPNVGGEQWSRKKDMHSKMLKFAEEIREINFEKIKCVPFMSYSHLTKESKKDPRTRAIEYSRSVPRPTLMGCEKSINDIPRSQSRDEINQLELLDQNHQKYMNLMKKI